MLVAVASAGIFIDAKRQAVESFSIEQGLELQRLERMVGTSWGRVLIANVDMKYAAGDPETAKMRLEQLEQTLDVAHDHLATMDPAPSWSETRDRLLTVAADGLQFLDGGPAIEDLLAWGWDYTEEFAGIFPADNRGQWSGLLEATRDAQYMVYSAADYVEVAMARAWANGQLAVSDPEQVAELGAIVYYLDDLPQRTPEGNGPFREALDLERARSIDAEIVAALEKVAGDSLVRLVENDFEYLAGLDAEAWFDDVDQIAPLALAVLATVDKGGEEVLQRAEAIVGESRIAAQRRGKAAVAGGSILLALGSLLFVMYWRGRARVESTLRHAAEIDPLTGLFNRFALFARALPMLANRTNGGFAILHIDLDDFKAINDRYGHSAGDAALRAFGDVCNVAVQGFEAIVARIGGDEFVILMTELAESSDGATVVSNLILTGLEGRELQANGHTFRVRATIGIATSEEPIHLDELLERADSALLDAKQSQRSQASTFGRNTRRNLVKEIGGALDEGRIVPAFQPIVRATDFKVIGLEGLGRWQREDGSQVPAADFVRALNALGDHERWFKLLLSESKTMLETLGDSFHGRVWLNVGAADVVRQGSASVASLLESSGVPLDRLGVEMMERVCESDLAVARRSLNAVRALGAQVALDDLGSDAIPLRHLNDLPLDRVKLDGSLIERVDTSDPSRRIIEGILAIAVNLGLTVVGECVETAAQERAMIQLGVTYLQGYRYSEALARDELTEFLNSHEIRRRLGATA